jgi:hypothetical protein
MLTVDTPFSYSRAQIQYFSALFQKILDGRKEHLAVAQIHRQIVLQLLSILLSLVVGKQVLPRMIGMIAQAAVHNMLSNAIGKAAGLVEVVGSVVASFDALY